MKNKKLKGWTNAETKLISDFFYDEAYHQVIEELTDGEEFTGDSIRWKCEDALLMSGMWKASVLHNVNWKELAENYMTDEEVA
tara:strand:+ start:477 stop:725 length:249 start_codon:yes stop_codon:yes gene_type:complete